MIAYKVFNPDWTCRGFKYQVGETYEEDINPSVCDRGFHFCKKLADCFNYYNFDSDNKVAEIEALGDISDGDDDGSRLAFGWEAMQRKYRRLPEKDKLDASRSQIEI